MFKCPSCGKMKLILVPVKVGDKWIYVCVNCVRKYQSY